MGRRGENEPDRASHGLSDLHNMPPDEPIYCIGCQ